MKRPRFRVACMTRRVRLKVRGSEPTQSSDDTKQSGIKPLKDRDRVARKMEKR